MDRLIALVLLHWKLEIRGLLRARERALSLVLVVPWLLLFSAGASVFVFAGVRAFASDPQGLRALLSLAVTLLGLMWALSPVLAGVAFTDTHDLTRLLHFPLPLSTLVASSVAANVTQPMVLAELPVATALALALCDRWSDFPLALLGALSSVAFMLVAAQCAGLAIHGLARNRRWQDLALFAGLGLGFLFSALPMLLIYGHWPLRAVLGGVLRRDLFLFSPFAWGVRAATFAGDGDFAAFAAWEGAQLVAVAGGLALATVLVGRIYRGDLSLGPMRGRQVGEARMRLSGALGALLEKDLRQAWRDPAIKAQLLMGIVWPLMMTVIFSQFRGPDRDNGGLLLMLAAFTGISTFGSNAFGNERRGVALLMGFPVDRWRILVAKNLATLTLRLPGLLVLLAAGIFLASPALIPVALVVALSTMAVSAGADNYISILFPITAPAAGRNPFGGGLAGGRGLGEALLSAILYLATMAAASPFVFLCWLPLILGRPLLWLLTLPLALLGAGAVYALLVGGAARTLSAREPELLERVLAEA